MSEKLKVGILGGTGMVGQRFIDKTGCRGREADS